MIIKYIRKLKSADINLKYFLVGVLLVGINNGILTTTFNNYLHDVFLMDAQQRGFLEFPREFPGFILIAVTGVLARYSIRSWSVLVGIFSGFGIFGLAYFSPSVYIMSFWMILWSMGDHLFMPVENTMGLYLAKDGKHGKRLGQISGARNLSMIFGAMIVYAVAYFLSDGIFYRVIYSIATITAVLSIVAFRKVHIHDDKNSVKRKFIFRKKYTVYYLLNILFGARKQIFLTFGPWVLVTVYGTTPETMALLIMTASLAGVIFRQYFGIFVDKFGEKPMFIIDAAILFFICAGFAFIKNVYFLYFLLILDNLMFATRIARTTYLKKIAVNANEIPATISLGITMDHFVSMTIPFLGGMIWSGFGYKYVFLTASILSFFSLFTALKVNSRSDGNYS